MPTTKVIRTFQSRDYTPAQLLELCKQLETVFEGLPVGDTTSRSVLTSYGQHVATLGKIVARDLASAFTARRTEADTRRDQLTVGFAAKVRGSLYSFSEAEKAAAASLVALLDKRPASFQQLSFEENTTELDLLLADLESAATAPALATLGLAAWVAELRRANDAFRAIQLEAAQSVTESEDLPRLTAIQPKIGEKLRLLLAITAHFNEQDVAPYPALMEQAYDRIVAVRAVARSRDAADEAEPDAPAPTA